MMPSPTNLLSRVNITETEAYEYSTPSGTVFALTSVLTIVPTIANDSGTYRCTTTNEVGMSIMSVSDEETTYLYVQGILTKLKFWQFI